MPVAARKRRVGTVLLFAVLAVVAVIAVVYFASAPTGLGSRPRLKPTGPASPSALTLPADHFTAVLMKDAPFLGKTVTVRDQFGERVLNLGYLALLWTPAAKVARSLSPNQAIKVSSYPNLHYLCYKVQEPYPALKGVKVRTTDQFGSWELAVGPQQMLCAPASKKVTAGSGHDPAAPAGDPALKEHLDCFALENAPSVSKTVTVRDQFGQKQLSVVMLAWLCAPSVKAVGERSPEGSFSDRHFLCYHVQPVFLPFDVQARDQFGDYPLNLKEYHSLCLPAKKELLQSAPAADDLLAGGGGCGDGKHDPLTEQCDPSAPAPGNACPDGSPCPAACACR
jgi:hypothetical protein